MSWTFFFKSVSFQNHQPSHSIIILGLVLFHLLFSSTTQNMEANNFYFQHRCKNQAKQKKNVTDISGNVEKLPTMQTVVQYSTKKLVKTFWQDWDLEFLHLIVRRHFTGNQWWHHKMLAVFSGYIILWTLYEHSTHSIHQQCTIDQC